jgi:hypothetical protein
MQVIGFVNSTSGWPNQVNDNQYYLSYFDYNAYPPGGTFRPNTGGQVSADFKAVDRTYGGTNIPSGIASIMNAFSSAGLTTGVATSHPEA